MSIARTVADVLSDHTTLELECVDRMYLNVYVPLLQTPGGVAHYLHDVCGYQVPSSALLAPRTRDFVAAIKRFVKRERIDLIQFQRGERKDDRAQDYLRRFSGDQGVLFVGVAQEKAHVPRTVRRRRPNSDSYYPWLMSSTECKHAPFHPREVLELPPEECASGASVEELKIKRKELLEFISEYGTADSLPELDSLRRFIAEEDLWSVNWKIFTRRGLHSDRLRKWTSEPASLEQMIAASQDSQAFVLKYHTEFFRRHKFAPCNGAPFFQFRRLLAGGDRLGGGLLRQKEEGLLRPAAGLQPYPRDDGVARPGRGAGGQHLPARSLRGKRLRVGYPSLTVAWQVLGAGDAVLAGGTITCAAPANGLQQVGEVSWDLPAAAGSYRVVLTLERDAEPLSRNQYTVPVHASAAAGGAEGLRGRGSRYRRRTGSAVEALVQERTTEDDTP